MLICITGAGGKTSLMYALAKQKMEEGIRVLLTTGTHIFMPKCDRAVWTDSVQELFREPNRLYVYGEQDEMQPEKLREPKGMDYGYLKQLSPYVISEADGAKGMPLKLPAEHEPVIPKECDVVIGVLGMQGYQKPMKEVCFRYTGPQKCADESVYRELMLSKTALAKGTENKRYIAVLGQADGDLFSVAVKIAKGIAAEKKDGNLRYPEKIYVVSHTEGTMEEIPVVQTEPFELPLLY